MKRIMIDTPRNRLMAATAEQLRKSGFVSFDDTMNTQTFSKAPEPGEPRKSRQVRRQEDRVAGKSPTGSKRAGE